MSHAKPIQPDPDAHRARRIAILTDFRATFTTDCGQRVLGVLDNSVQYGKPAFLPPAGGGSYDPIAAAFRDGRKSVLAEIHDYLATAEDNPGAETPKAKT